MNGILSMGDVLAYAGTAIGLVGAALAVGFACYASGRGTGAAGEAGAGLLAEQPNMFGKVLIMQVLPGTQGLYGFAISFIVMLRIGVVGSKGVPPANITEGLMYLAGCLAIAVGGYFSAVAQGRVCASGINIIAKKPEESSKAIVSATLVELYALLSFIISFFLVYFIDKIVGLL